MTFEDWWDSIEHTSFGGPGPLGWVYALARKAFEAGQADARASAPPAVPVVAEKREPKAGDTWKTSIGDAHVLVERNKHGWVTRTGRGQGWIGHALFESPPSVAFVRAAAPPPGEGREPKTCRFCKGVPRPGCAHCEGTGRDLCWKRCTVNKAPGYCKLDEGHDGKCGPRVCSATPGEETPK